MGDPERTREDSHEHTAEPIPGGRVYPSEGRVLWAPGQRRSGQPSSPRGRLRKSGPASAASWTRLDLERTVKRAVEQAVDGSESEADLRMLVDRLLAKLLEPLAQKRRETARAGLIAHGVAYLRLQLAAEDLDARERLSIERDANRDLNHEVTGEESTDDVEILVDGILDELRDEPEEEDLEDEWDDEDKEQDEEGEEDEDLTHQQRIPTGHRM